MYEYKHSITGEIKKSLFKKNHPWQLVERNRTRTSDDTYVSSDDSFASTMASVIVAESIIDSMSTPSYDPGPSYDSGSSSDFSGDGGSTAAGGSSGSW